MVNVILRALFFSIMLPASVFSFTKSSRRLATKFSEKVAQQHWSSNETGFQKLWMSTGRFSPSVSLFYNDIFEVELPPTHRFPMKKYRMVRESLQKEFQNNPSVSFTPSPLVSIKDLSLVHEQEYIQRYVTGKMTEMEIRRSGFLWSEASVARSLSSTGGTVAATRALCRSWVMSQEDSRIPQMMFAGHLAGGTHHAFPARAEGFCIFSDIAVAAAVALRDFPSLVKKILIVDLDVHQGNGNAVIFADDPRVVTFSMHCKGNYFSKVEQSDFDVEVPEGADDHDYLVMLEDWLPRLMDEIRPDLIFYQAGVDGLGADRLGKLRLTRGGLRLRNRLVYDLALEQRAPAVLTMGGGYPKDLDPASAAFRTVVGAHGDVYADAVAAAAAAAAAGEADADEPSAAAIVQ